MKFSTLREASIARLPTFKNSKGEPAHSKSDGSDWDLDDWVIAVGGEVGEVLGELTKVRRGDFTLGEARKDIGKEIADVIIYLDLLAYQIDAYPFGGGRVYFENLNAYGAEHTTQWYGNKIMIKAGNLACVRDATNCNTLLRALGWLARHLDIDLTEAVRDKFNEVSVRVGSPVRIQGDQVITVQEKATSNGIKYLSIDVEIKVQACGACYRVFDGELSNCPRCGWQSTSYNVTSDPRVMGEVLDTRTGRVGPITTSGEDTDYGSSDIRLKPDHKFVNENGDAGSDKNIGKPTNFNVASDPRVMETCDTAAAQNLRDVSKALFDFLEDPDEQGEHTDNDGDSK